MTTLELSEARQLAVQSQLLPEAGPLPGSAGVRTIIEQLGYVQIDTISVVSRAHHHVLWSRKPDFKPSDLEKLEEERVIFEYWAHAASYLPMADYRFSLVRKEAFLNGGQFWFEKDHKTVDYVFDQIRAEGPLMSKDFKAPPGAIKPGTGMDWARNPLNLALRQLFMEGRIMVAHRKGFQKSYDLPERVLPAGVNTNMPAEEEYLRYLIMRDVRAHGLARAKEIGYLLKINRQKLQQLLDGMAAGGELLPARVQGLGAAPYYVRPGSLEGLPSQAGPTLRILSPFDNLVIQRKRLEELFGFSYLLECYVPADKRKFGYFALPLFWDNGFAGKLDLKADRKTGVLWVRNAEFESPVKHLEALAVHLLEQLKSFAAFNGCRELAAEPGLKGKFGPLFSKFFLF